MRLLNVFLCISAVGVAQGFQPGLGRFLHGKGTLRIPAGGDPLVPPRTRSEKSPLLFSPLPATAADVPPQVEPWTKPRLHNNPLVRSGAVLAALALAGRSSAFHQLSAASIATIHLLSFATWFGTVFYTTFIAGITMFKALPRQTFGNLQSKLFPKYFSLCSLSLVLQIVTLTRLRGIGSVASKALWVSLGMTLLNQFILEPKSTKIMFERYDLENSDDPDAAMASDQYKVLRSSFGKLHGMSSLSNLIALCGAAMHGVCLSAALVAGAAV